MAAQINQLRGEQIYNHKLSAADVRVIRQRLAEGESTRGIAFDYPVTHQAIASIASGRTWKHLNDRVR